jgi:replicative DNA helicase
MQDMAAEKSIISGIYQFGMKGFNEVSDIVSEECFTDLGNKATFACLTSLMVDQEAVDVGSLLSKANELSVVHLVDNTENINEILNFNIQLSSLRGLAHKLDKLRFIRESRNKLKETHDDLGKLNGSESFDEIVSTFETPVLDFSLSQENEETRLLYRDIEQRASFLEEEECDFVGLPTGFPSVDRFMGGGMRRKAITLWASRTGVGKSMMAGCISRHNAKDGVPILILDTEMSDEDQIVRSLANFSGVPISTIEQGKFKRDERERAAVWKAVRDLKNFPIYYRSVAGKSFDEVLSIARRWIVNTVGKSGGITNECLIVYDYFKLMGAEGMNNLQEYQALGFQISKMHDFCVKYDVPVLAFVQTNREDDIAQSDRLSWLASSVSIFSERTEEEVADHPEWGNLKIVPKKNRFGPGLLQGDYVCLNKIGSTAKIEEVGLKSNLLNRAKQDKEEKEVEF